jgi:hypothetical protein
LGQLGVAGSQPSSRCHTVRLVDKLLWPHLVEIVKQL